MKKKYVLHVFLIFISLVSISSHAQSNTITLNALPGGTEGTTIFTDTSTLSISASGVVSYSNSNAFDDWGVAASTITQSGALDKTFGVLIGGMASVDIAEGKNYGKKILDGGIDRASDGALGIRGGAGNGIDVNEGIYFGLDLASISSSASLQITKIYVTLAGSTNESGVIVSRLNPSKRIIFGNSTTPGVNYPVTNGVVPIDISSFNVYLQGGAINNDMVALFNNSPIVNNIRITGIELKVLTNSLDTSSLSNMAHPRLLLKAGEEALIQSLISTSPEHNKSHTYIIETANSFLQAPPIVKPTGTRILSESHDAIEQIFYLSYAYRMTGQTQYLTKAETVMNDVCNWDNWITYSLDTAEMTFAVAIGYDWLYNGLTADTRQKAREKILNYGFLTQKSAAFWNYTSNWNQVCIGALSCAALAIYGDGTTQMNTEAAFVLNNILVKNPNSMNTYNDGNYPEGPMYWSYGTSYEVLMLSALEGVYGKNHEGINRLIASPGFLESAEFMQYATGPSALYFNYSDSTAKRIPLPAALWMAEKANKPSWLSEEKKLMQNGSYASNFENRRFLPLALIYGKNISIDNLPDPQAKLWKGYGEQPVVMARTAWQGSTGKYMGIKGGTPTYSHAQMDGGFFVYDSQGVRWGMDFGKYDYDAQGTIDGNDFSQNSQRWDIFRVSNLSQNTISIKKASETNWQHHKVDGDATIDEIYDTTAKRGAKVNMKSLLGLNNELQATTRSVYLVDDSYLEIKDYLSNSSEPINLYWNMVTTALVETVSPSKIKLTQGGKTVILEIVSSNPAVTFTLATNRSTDPVFYNPTATADSKNPGTVMLGFEATIPANNDVTFTVTIKDDAEVPPSSIEPINNIVLDLPNPTTGLEGNSLYYDTSELNIDANGEVTIGGESINYAWSVYGDTNLDSADNSKFFFRWKGMGTTNINQGVNYGALLTPAGMDRASTGELGVRGGAGAGIDPNEGFNLGFDLSYLPNTVQLQLVKVGVSEVTGTENGVIVNRKDTSKRTTFGGSSSTASVKFSTGKGDVNVESLGITLTGGETNYDLASLFNPSGSGSFRMNKFVFKLLTPSYSITASTTENGSVTGTGTYQAGTTATLIATPSAGYSFLKWTEAGGEVSTNTTYLFTVTGARILVANFVPLISVTSCNSYIWNGIEYTTTGMYTGTTANGQTQKLNLTIIPATTIGSESVSVCGNAYTWPTSGTTYMTSGTYTYVESCNTATLTLTLTPNTTVGSITQTQAGGTYTWPKNGITYSESTVVVITEDCNTATLNLTINAPSQIPASFDPFCKGATVANAAGATTMKFYTALTGGLPLAATTALATKTLFVSEMVGLSESSPRVARLITVNPLPTEVLGAMTSNTVSATTTTGFVATTLVVGQYVGTTTTISYRIPAFGGSGLSYLWTVPAGVTIVGSSETNVLSVHYNDVAAGVGTIGAIKVQAVNTNGCAGTAKSITVSKVLPSAPGSIKMTNAALPLPLSGVAASITTFAPYMGTTTELTLTAKPSLTATSYVWELPTGVNVTNGSATTDEGITSSTSNVITVNFAGVTSSNTYNYLTTAFVPVSTNVLRIGVKARNGVGVSVTSNSTLANSSLDFTPNSTSTTKLLTLTATKPVASASLKMFDLAASSTVAITDISKFIGTDTELTLTAAVSKLASSYLWEIPEMVTIVDGSDEASNSIKVTFKNVPDATASLYLGVKAVNGIGSSVTNNSALTTPATTSEARLLKVTAKAPATPGTVVGSLAICSTTASDGIYSITAAAAGANTYNVTAPVGCTINGGVGNTATIAATAGATFTVNYPIGFIATTTVIKTITIQSVNGFGNSISNKVLKLTNVGASCAPKFVNASAADEFNVIAYPNPSSDVFNIDVQSSDKGATGVQVYDMAGRLIESRQAKSNSVEVGSRYASGVYNVKVNKGAKVKTLRVIKK